MSNELIPNKCFEGECKWRIQGETCVVCSHKNKITYKKLDNICDSCGRRPNGYKNSCGDCIGRGLYVYPYIYEDCDCGGYEPKIEKK